MASLKGFLCYTALLRYKTVSIFETKIWLSTHNFFAYLKSSGGGLVLFLQNVISLFSNDELQNDLGSGSLHLHVQNKKKG
jgi:hypothetical protein